jgi:hypothetical protein
MVDLAPLDRPVVDVRAGVVADRGRLVDERAERDVLLVGTEHGAVDEVDRLAVVGAVATGGRHRVEAVLGGAEPQMAQADVRAHRLQLDE